MEHCDILIIGGGIAGLSAAREAYTAGCARILLVERKPALGGVLRQCFHSGFGTGLDGPTYLSKIVETFPKEIRCLTDTTVVSITKEKTALLKSGTHGEKTVAFEQLILASGCWEIPMGSLSIAGTRPQGIYTAGQMQEMMNLHGFRPEGPVVILGSGDLGMIIAKHLYDAGIPVAALVEQKDTCGAMARNQQFLPRSGIPLIYNNTITQVFGYPRLEGVILADGRTIPCKTLLIAAGFKPNRTLIHSFGEETWLHLCGNCHKLYPMVEGVITDGRQAALSAVSALGKSTK